MDPEHHPGTSNAKNSHRESSNGATPTQVSCRPKLATLGTPHLVCLLQMSRLADGVLLRPDGTVMVHTQADCTSALHKKAAVEQQTGEG